MKAEIKGNNLVITIELQKPTLSTSGKTKVVASTHGNKESDVVIEGKRVTIGVNCYIAK